MNYSRWVKSASTNTNKQNSPFCFLVVAGGTGALGVTITGRGTTGGAELPAGWATGGWTGRNDWLGGWLLSGWLLGGWLLGGWLLGEGWTGRNDW